MRATNYRFKGSEEEISNNILSLLYSKEHYGMDTHYSHLVNESYPVKYNNQMKSVLERMQMENLILIKGSSVKEDNADNTHILIREYGKEVLATGGYSKNIRNNGSIDSLTASYKRIKYGSVVAVILSVIALIWYIVS